MTKSFLTPTQRDGLRETANIGAGQASIYLSDLIDGRVEIEVPSIDIMDLSSSINKFGDLLEEDEEFFNISYKFKDLDGILIFGLSDGDINKFLKEITANENELDYENKEDIRRVADRMAEQYIEAINKFLSLDIEKTSGIPNGKYPSTLLHSAVSQFEETHRFEEEKVMIDLTRFEIVDSCEGFMVLVISVENLDKLTDSLESLQ